MAQPVAIEPPATRTFAQVEAEVLATALPGYEPRSQQTAGASFVEQVLSDKALALLQAGTGVGKSLATLIPVIESGKRTIVATATNALLSQYSKKDMPFLQEHLGASWALLKGIRNYACQAKIAEVNSMDVPNIAKLRDELGDDKLHDGDKERVSTPLTDIEWSRVSSSSDECPGRSHCPFSDGCYVMAARDRAQAAQVVVTNQMMLMTDAVIGDAIGDHNPILGPHDQVVVDEAHELDDWARKALTLDMNKVGVENTAAEAAGFLGAHGGDPDVTNAIHRAVADVWEVLPDDGGRMRLSFFVNHSREFIDLIQGLDRTRAAVLDIEVPADDKRSRSRQNRVAGKLSAVSDKLRKVVVAADGEYVRWVTEEDRTYQGQQRRVKVFHAAPIDVSDFLGRNLWATKSAVLVSATLKAGGDFAYVQEQLGLQAARTLDVGTSFDFPTQARLFVPPSTAPNPKNRAAWQMYAIESTMDLVEAAGGGALLLFTSRSAMRDAHQALSPRLRGRGYTVLMQNADGTNQELAQRFDQDTDSVLFALRSFMTGVSFEGDTCRLVVIDKLPFPVPTDPIFESRSEMYGQQAFGKLSIPMMSLVLEQAIGRLIRTKRDKGVMAILDSRLASTGYGRKIVRSLPPARQISTMDEARAFFSAR
jgi:ATP-dependent DNA helicase DinG